MIKIQTLCMKENAMKKIYPDLRKEFVSQYGSTTICREDYEDLMCAMAAVELSDDKMQEIVDKINQAMDSEYDRRELGLLERYRGGGCGMTDEQIGFAENMSEREFEFFETIAIEVGMRYYEDMTDEECVEIANLMQQAK